MEREEVETIPWSNLVMEPESRFDRRWVMYAIVGVAAVLAVVGFRAVSGGGQPTPPGMADPAPTSTTVPEPSMVVSEQELRSAGADDAAVSLRAEWFITDFFTNDGSAETGASIRAALGEAAESVDLAAIRPSSTRETFVEWARTVGIDFDGSEYHAIVAYRSLTLVGSDYRRQPVRAVEVGIRIVDGIPLISTLPIDVEGFWDRSAREG